MLKNIETEREKERESESEFGPMTEDMRKLCKDVPHTY
jgi:hypothetical protein